jgi:hypothetical protein
MILKVILNDCNTSVAMAFNLLELQWENTVITTIATNSFNISDLESQAVQQIRLVIANKP